MPPVSTDPAAWFLTDRKNPQSQLTLYTGGNKVTPLIDGEAYMSMVYDLIQLTTEGDYILHTAWRADADQRLKYGDDESTLIKALTRAHARKVDIRIMLSNHVATGFPCQPNRRIHNELVKAKIPVVFDARHSSFGSAHHKTTLILERGLGVLNAFCGGLDFAHERWDTPAHAHGSDPKRQGTEHAAWHDVNCLVLGPAARDLDLSFRERWNDPRDPRFADDAPERFEAFLSRDATAEAGTNHVQVLKTYVCQVPPYPFAEKGEFTLRDAYLKAIGMAQDYIYIEDQFFTSHEIADALESAMKRAPSLRVIVLVPKAPESPITWSHNEHQAEILTRFQMDAPDRFAAYHLQTLVGSKFREIFVHAKVMIVDDVWACISSMNCNRRSLTHDAEIGVAVVDKELTRGVCKFAFELRRSLWAEHLRLDRLHPDLVDPIEGFDKWRALARVEGERVRAHATDKPRLDLFWGIVDPVGTCKI